MLVPETKNRLGPITRYTEIGVTLPKTETNMIDNQGPEIHSSRFNLQCPYNSIYNIICLIYSITLSYKMSLQYVPY